MHLFYISDIKEKKSQIGPILYQFDSVLTTMLCKRCWLSDLLPGMSDWPKMGQIRTFSESDLKIPGFVPFGVNHTHFVPKI